MTPSPADPVRVLLVDDQQLFVDAVAALLALDARVEVVGVAHNAKEARTLAAQADVALVDLVLPGDDGAALSRELRTATPGLRVVLVSGRADAELRDAAEAAGASAYLRKGSLGAEIVDVVLDVAGR